jgi:hypothetical protein
MKQFFIHAIINWKSTLSSILTTTFVVTLGLMQLGTITPHVAAWIIGINSASKIWLGAISTDGVVIPANSTIHQQTSTTIKVS